MKTHQAPPVIQAIVFMNLFATACSSGDRSPASYATEPSLQATSLAVSYDAKLDSVVFEITTAGDAASVVPTKAGQVDGAPVLGYVFPTTLQPQWVGFGDVAGTVALAVTSHPDFDDTPLWDENGSEAYDDDGAIYHSHWVVLHEDGRAPAGIAVVQSNTTSTLPPTAPMPMYLDSPGFTVIEDGSRVRVLVPADRIQRQFDFKTGALTAFMQVDATGSSPLLAVHEILSQLNEGEVNTPVANRDEAPASAWPTPETDDETFNIVDVSATYSKSVDTFIMSMTVVGSAAKHIPVAAGQVDGAPVVGYVFPTSIPPTTLGFQDIQGTVALAVTSHPDFDDTPNWDENFNQDFEDDGATYHVHWVVLVNDPDSDAGYPYRRKPM
ncbi:MAG: hypothetical protein R3C68_18225 [Myxococcota bacterium]